MRSKVINSLALTTAKNFQLEQALAIESGCNMSEVRFSYTENYIYVHFYVGSFRQCAIIKPNGDYWDFREAISNSVKEAKSLAA